jgi:hypothetical protein
MDESASIPLGLDDRVARQQLISLRHRLAVELEIVRELADRRQRITGLQHAGRDGSLDLFDELLELWNGVVEIDGDFHRACTHMYQLNPWYNWFTMPATGIA